MANGSVASLIGFDYPDGNSIASASSMSMLPGVATANGGYKITSPLKNLGNEAMGLLDSPMMEGSILALTSLALKGLSSSGGHTVERSHSSTTPGVGTSTTWSPATESLIKLLDGMDASWTKMGTPKQMTSREAYRYLKS